MKEIASQLSDRDIVMRQVGKPKLKRAEEIAKASEKAFIDWETYRLQDHPDQQTEIPALAKKYGMIKGENYLWPNRINAIETAWNQAIVEDIGRSSGKLLLSPSRKPGTLEAARSIEATLEKAAVNKPNNPWDYYERSEFIVAAGIEAAERGLVGQAKRAMDMLEENVYEKGIIAAMIHDSESANKVVERLLRGRIEVKHARQAAEIGQILEDQGIVTEAINKIIKQKRYPSAAELALEFDEPEIARGLVPVMLQENNYSSAGRTAFSLGDLESVNTAIEQLVQKREFRSALELVNLTKDRGAALKIWQLLEKMPESEKIEKLKATALKIYFDESA
ncbi:hypothetical protein M1349_04775 [Patescibacteria group bacterium]|nr:hypothetical protein [Patescibacteria group bacterium]